MDPTSYASSIHYSLIFNLCLALCFLSISHSAAGLGSDSDKEALLSLKSHISNDPFGAMTRWNDSAHFCSWNGVLCSRRHVRVIAIDLGGQNLTGTISPFIGNLSFLMSINFRSNFFHGVIPREIGRLHRLKTLGLSRNLLQGSIPIEVSNCSELISLELVINNFEGTIPEEIGRLSRLKGLGLTANNLTGSIPGSISNLTSLVELYLSENSLSGDIPLELGNLRKLYVFLVSVNQLTGPIPPQLYNISSLTYFGVSENQLVEEIPPDIGFSLPNVRKLLLGNNKFTGRIPESIANATKLEWLEAGNNSLSGSVPKNLGNLKNLVKLTLGMNNLGTGDGTDLDFLHSLVNCTSLEVLAFNNNSLTGVLPSRVIANLSTRLEYLLMGANRISGEIPIEISKLENLLSIGMEENLFTGSIPSSIGHLKNLNILSIFGNRFSGKIPETIGNMSSLVELGLDNNDLSGVIPPSLGDCLRLQILRLSWNGLSGSIPGRVISLSSLSDWLDLSSNKLTGSVPSEVGNLRNLRTLDLSDNELSGEIPSSIESCSSLEVLYLSGNSFQGHIPSSIKYIKGIQELDLSSNNFTGRIPGFFSSLPFLKALNLSYNNLEGEVPSDGIFRNMAEISLSGNNKLCGGIPRLGLRPCPSVKHSKGPWKHLYFRVIVITICVVACLAFLAFLFIMRRNVKQKKVEVPSLRNELPKITYSELFKATDGFSSENLIGTGNYGSVYKGRLDNENSPIAVKVLNLQEKGATKSFVAECEALRNIRHRNLIKVITSCSSIDSARNEFKALVFEFMPNGSLEKWLHGSDVRTLSFWERLSIAVDVAHALDYLHNEADHPVVHCDMKPSNVLLDEEMVARVGDFGLAKLLYDKNVPVIESSLSTNNFKGTIGYVAPEYGLAGKVSTRGDVYSFGVLLLEMFTGKRPTDEMFMEGLSLHSFVERVIPDRVTDITDPSILEEMSKNHEDLRRGNTRRISQKKTKEALVMVFNIGVLCSKEPPGERMDIKEAVGKLQSIKYMMIG